MDPRSFSKRTKEYYNRVRKDKKKSRALLIAVIIALLVLGYLPFSRFLFRTININYTLDMEQVSLYEREGSEKREPERVEAVSIKGDGETRIISGLLMQERLLEVMLDYRGIGTYGMDLEVEFLGEPEEFWVTCKQCTGNKAIPLPLYLRRLEKEDWEIIRKGGLALYNKDERFRDLSGFFEFAVETRTQIGLLGCTTDDVLLSLEGEEPGRKLNLLKWPIRGHHTIEFLVTNNSLSVEMEKIDINMYEGEDTIPVNILRNGQVIYQDSLIDDGNTSNDNRITREPIVKRIGLEDIENGLYQMEIGGQEDIDFDLTRIVTSAAKAVFIDRVFLDYQRPLSVGEGRAINMYVVSQQSYLSATTWHEPEFTKTVFLDGNELLSIAPPNTKGSAEMPWGFHKLRVVNPEDLILEVKNSRLSFYRSRLFDPIYLLLVPVEDHSLDEFNCFLVGSYGYPTPVDKDNAYTSTLKVRDITIPPGTLELLFRKEGQGDIVIPSMRITLIRSSE